MSVFVKFRWRTSVFGTTMVFGMKKQFSASFQTAFDVFCKVRFGCAVFRNSFEFVSEVSMRFYSRCEFIFGL